MARADLLKKLFVGYQRRDDPAFRQAAEELIVEERKKQHSILANELERILRNGYSEQGALKRLVPMEPGPMDSERRMALIEVRQPQRYMDDLILDSRVRSTVDRVMREFREREVLEANGLMPVRRVIFCGPSGCGKTAMAEAMAAELAIPMLYVRFDAVVSSLLGETAANLRKVFDYAQRGQWILFFDEFDAIGRSRDDATEHGEIKRVLNSFLQIVDNFDGRSLVIAATNFEQVLDPAVWRRFDEMVRFERPGEPQLKLLARRRLGPVSFTDVQVDRLATSLVGASYADAERVCLDIRKVCVMRSDRKVNDQDVEDALARQVYRQSVLLKALASGAPAVDRD
ncbi:MAG: ATP-binding protein [Bryobacteraceae bacterium]|jgi:SpoVK/Ycf46/Vps4 family AAA+-type ATPase